ADVKPPTAPPSPPIAPFIAPPATVPMLLAAPVLRWMPWGAGGRTIGLSGCCVGPVPAGVRASGLGAAGRVVGILLGDGLAAGSVIGNRPADGGTPAAADVVRILAPGIAAPTVRAWSINRRLILRKAVSSLLSSLMRSSKTRGLSASLNRFADFAS